MCLSCKRVAKTNSDQRSYLFSYCRPLSCTKSTAPLSLSKIVATHFFAKAVAHRNGRRMCLQWRICSAVQWRLSFRRFLTCLAASDSRCIMQFLEEQLGRRCLILATASCQLPAMIASVSVFTATHFYHCMLCSMKKLSNLVKKFGFTSTEEQNKKWSVNFPFVMSGSQ